MSNKVFLYLVVMHFCLSSWGTQAQPHTNALSDSDSMSHYENAAGIRREIDSLRMDLNEHMFTIDSIQAETKTIMNQLCEKNKDNTSDLLSIINILVVIAIFIITTILSKKQKKLGIKIGEYTGEINNSIKHFERRYLINQDRTIALDTVSQIEFYYQEIIRRISLDYNHFVRGENIDSRYENLYLDICRGVSKIKAILNYNNISDEKIPSEEAYIKAVSDLLFQPDLVNLNEQIDSFKREGEKYHGLLKQVIKEIDNRHL